MLYNDKSKWRCAYSTHHMKQYRTWITPKMRSLRKFLSTALQQRCALLAILAWGAMTWTAGSFGAEQDAATEAGDSIEESAI